MARTLGVSVLLLIGFNLLKTAYTQTDKPIYTIAAPKVLRPSSVYNVTATCFNVAGDVTLTLRIQAEDNTTLVEEQTVLTNGVPQIVSLTISVDVPEANYALVALGTGAFVFNDSKSISVNRKTLSIFVQTDKPLYKPGQTVQLRAIAVYPDLKPYQGSMDIVIYDLGGNKIKQWLRQNDDSGVVAQSLPLSDQTPLGDWQIVINAAGNSFKKTFQVAEYVLPKFEVTVNLPQFYLVNTNKRDLQEDLTATIIAKYTYGQPVKGRANVTIQIQPYGYYDNFNYTRISLNMPLVDGKVGITVKIKDLLALAPVQQYSYASYTPDPWSLLSYRTILVIADVNETVTGKVLSGNNTVDCKAQKYDLTFSSFTPDNYKPGLLYTAYMQLSKPDGTNPDTKDIMQSNGEYAKILLIATMNYPPQTDRYGSAVYPPATLEKFNVTFDPSGLMSFSFFIYDNITSVSLEASFYVEVTNSTSYAYKSINVFKSRDNQSIQISFNSQVGVIKALQEVAFDVLSNEPIMTFQYAILSKGSIQLSGNVAGDMSTKHSFSVWISKDLAMKLTPSARVIAWLITKNGEIIADSIEVTVSDGFGNKVSLSFDRNATTPSQNVSYTVKADSGSSVFVLAVDQSVLLLKTGNDITEDLVTSDLKDYDSTSDGGNFYPLIGRGIERKKRSIWYPFIIGGQDSASIFSNAGVVMMTNALIYEYTYRYPLYAMRPGGDGMQVPMAAPGAPGAPGATGKGDSAPPAQETSEQPRTNFPETWLWTNAVTGPDGSVTLQTSVPDTITSWVASAFAVSPITGLGVAPESAKLTVFKQFFLSPSLPYSIIRGEQFALQVTVFNYLSAQLKVVVSLEKSTYFTVKGEQSVTAEVDSNDAVSVYFWIVAGSLGQIPIHITGVSPVAGDSLIVMLLVKPEGVQKQYSTSVFVQLPSDGSAYNTTLDVSLPPAGELVPGSEYIEVTAIGDIMGPSVNGLDALLQMPYGCGEQNMLTFAPDVYICKYLSVSNQLTSDIESKALRFMNAGYQRELTYQRTIDGSFSAFGDSDLSGSIWLSAFVSKCFHQAKDYMSIEDSKIARTMNWTIGNQLSDGSFAEPPNGRVIHVDMQGGSSMGLPLTAYVLIALLENKDNPHVDPSNLTSSIKLAQQYLEDRVESVSLDPYSLAIMSYALARAKSQKVNEVLGKLEALAKNEAGTKHWEKVADVDSSPELRMWQPPYSQARSVNIEMTAYVLLTWCEVKNLSMGLPIAKWIISQRNSNGGFSSTQDTVVALEALAEFATMILGPSGERDALISVSTNLIQYDFLRITAETSILYQSYQLPSNTTRVYVKATGKGSALIQLNAKYNVYQTEDVSGINLNVKSTQNGNQIIIKSCSSWQKKEGSGMVVMEINQLTGFQASNVDDLKSNDVIKRVETSDEKIVLYFDELTSSETCVNLVSDKVFPVTNVQDAPVKVFPYYDPSGERVQLYGAPQALGQNSVCSECPQCCNGSNDSDVTQNPTNKMPDTSTHNGGKGGDATKKLASKMSTMCKSSTLVALTILVFVRFCVARLQ